jgi:hypothetical protein
MTKTEYNIIAAQVMDIDSFVDMSAYASGMKRPAPVDKNPTDEQIKILRNLDMLQHRILGEERIRVILAEVRGKREAKLRGTREAKLRDARGAKIRA